MVVFGEPCFLKNFYFGHFDFLHHSIVFPQTRYPVSAAVGGSQDFVGNVAAAQ